MNLEQVSARVEKVAALIRDFEAAHIEEDALYRDVLAYIASGGKGGRVLAAEALKTQRLKIHRYYA